MRYLVFCCVFILFVFPLLSQKEVKEEISVDWWVLPVFAVDKSGSPILDLQRGDIELVVNNQLVSDFILYKRSFSVDRKAAIKTPLPSLAPKLEKRRAVFFLFDPVFSSKDNYEKSKFAAKEMAAKADADTLFTLMIVDPFAGLVHAGGPTADRQQVLDLIEDKIRWNPKAKDRQAVMFAAFGTSASGYTRGKVSTSHSRISPKEQAFLLEEFSTGIKKSNLDYLRSFETFYYGLNSIKDNKFVYLFSEGISLFARKVIRHADEEYWYFLKRAGGFLGQSGAVLFIINPAGAVESFLHSDSGEDTLRYLARESGGTYMEGAKASLSERIEQMHRAYYEIAFPEQDEFQGTMRHVTLKSRRQDTRLHTLRVLEKSKRYHEMKPIEREVLALNLVQPNPLYRFQMTTRPLEVEEMTDKGDQTHYRVRLPRDFQARILDLYKIWLDEESSRTTIEKEEINPLEPRLHLVVKNKAGIRGRLVLICEKENTALVQGLFDADKTKRTALTEGAAAFKKKAARMTQAERKELQGILAGAADYCAKLEDAILHYVCKEKIAEILEVLRTHKAEKESETDFRTGVVLQGLRGKHGKGSDVRVVKRKLTNKYVNDYQLIRSKESIQEQRVPLQGEKKAMPGQGRPVDIETFISRKISMAPLTLLGAESQEKFAYRFVKYEKIKGSKTAVIECFPGDIGDVKSNFGKIWIDLHDFSVLRMRLNPVSIGGYPMLLKLARDFEAKLTLTCQIDFGKVYNGLRFPTSVQISEKYSGGRQLRRLVGKSYWERSKTTYTFDDYQFFEVDVTSKAEVE